MFTLATHAALIAKFSVYFFVVENVVGPPELVNRVYGRVGSVFSRHVDTALNLTLPAHPGVVNEDALISR